VAREARPTHKIFMEWPPLALYFYASYYIDIVISMNHTSYKPLRITNQNQTKEKKKRVYNGSLE
jgi:uncharacterized membrane-anchored protein YitT (DUF2179 family)